MMKTIKAPLCSFVGGGGEPIFTKGLTICSLPKLKNPEVFYMIEDMKIFHKTYEFIKWLHTLLNKFPKSEKYTMAQKIENTSLNFLESIIQSNNDFEKIKSLQKAIIELDKLRIFFRLSKDLQFISFEQYEYGSNLINEIGRMLGGWYKKYSNIPLS